MEFLYGLMVRLFIVTMFMMCCYITGKIIFKLLEQLKTNKKMKIQFIKVLTEWGYFESAFIKGLYEHKDFSSIDTRKICTLKELMYAMYRAGEKDTQNEIRKAIGL